jgi:hypothetical protein
MLHPEVIEMKKRIASAQWRGLLFSAATLAMTLLAVGAKWRPN